VDVSFGGTAVAGDDYVAVGTTVTFADGETTADVTITPIDDTFSEPTETVSLTVEPNSLYTIGANAIATIRILDNDAQVASVEKVSDAAEGGGSGALRFTRTGDLTNSLTVSYTVGGTATSGTDYTALAGTVTFAAGLAAAAVLVDALPGDGYDPAETVTVTLSVGPGYSVGAVSATMTIDDDAGLTFVVGTDQGATWYGIPWGDVDPDVASQSLPLMNFALLFAGQTLTPATGTFTTSPTAQSEYGEFEGITFAITTSGIGGFPYSSVSVSGLTVTAVAAVTGQILVVNADEPKLPTGKTLAWKDFKVVKEGEYAAYTGGGRFYNPHTEIKTSSKPDGLGLSARQPWT
jgi:hypothetical protein